jgi:glycosyltransferase involved in cell wall biosynthesis
MKVAVIIPALNEADCIGDVVKQTLAQPVDQVIVVDNGSTDNTADAARQAGAHVLCDPRHGYGYACAAGVAMTENVDVLVFLDGDHSFLPGEMPLLLAPLSEGRADLVLGSRERGYIAPGAMPPHQRFGNWLVARLIGILYGLRLTDQGPFRAVRRDLVCALDMREMTFGWPTEMIVKAARQRARIVEVPISYHPRRTGHSKVSGTFGGTLQAGYQMLKVVIRSM